MTLFKSPRQLAIDIVETLNSVMITSSVALWRCVTVGPLVVELPRIVISFRLLFTYLSTPVPENY